MRRVLSAPSINVLFRTNHVANFLCLQKLLMDHVERTEPNLSFLGVWSTMARLDQIRLKSLEEHLEWSEIKN